MSDQNFENELNKEELNRVSNALDALQQHNEQPTKNAWGAIMEESNQRSRHISRRTQILSVAAAAAVILAIAGATLVLINSKETGGVKTVDKNKNDKVETTTTTTTSTTPLSNEQQVLKNTIQLKQINIPSQEANRGDNVSYDIYDPISGKKLYELPRGDQYPYVSLLGLSGNVFTGTGLNQDYEPAPNFSLFLDSGKIIKTDGLYRIYSPDKSKYAEFNGIEGSSAQSVAIVDTKTGKRRVLKPETATSIPESFSGNDLGDNPQEYIAEIIWLNNSKFIFRTNIAGMYTQIWRLGNLDAPISITKSEKVSRYELDGAGDLLDAREYNGQTYILEWSRGGSESEAILIVRNLSTGKELWTKSYNMSDTSVLNIGDNMYLGSTPEVVYGSVTDSKGNRESYIFDHQNNKEYTPGGDIVLPVR